MVKEIVKIIKCYFLNFMAKIKYHNYTTFDDLISLSDKYKRQIEKMIKMMI